MIERIAVVLGKELRDNVRDRRALLSALVYPLLGPGLLVGLLAFVGYTFSEQAEERMLLPVAGASEAPDLMRFLAQHNVAVSAAPADPEAAVRAGEEDLVLIVPPGFAADFAAGRPASLQLVLDDSRQSAAVSIRRGRRLLEAYGAQIAALRLVARGLSPEILSPLAVEELDLATPQSQAAGFLNLTPYFVIYSIFIGGMYLAIDTTAGERERGSLEPLLLNPARRGELVLGKLGATLVFTLVAVVETLLAFWLVLALVPLERFLGVQFSFSLEDLAQIFLITLPMMPLAAALQIIIASSTHSFKEAQNYLSLLPLVPALPGMFLAFMPVEPRPGLMLIPTFGQQLLMNRILRGEPVAPEWIAISALVTLAAAVVLIAIAIRLYSRERFVFGR